MNGRVLLRSVGLGLAAGMRAMAPHAGLRLARGRGGGFPLALSAMELIGDKLPMAGDRTALPSLLSRIASGALAGRLLARMRRSPVLLPMAAGGLAAWAGTYAFHALRMKLTSPEGRLLPAFAEDTVAVGLTRASLRLS